RTTNNEFIIVRFLLEEVGRLLYYYLIFIRPFTCILYWVCLGLNINSPLLFSSLTSLNKLLKTYSLTKILMRFLLSIKIYRQVSITIIEKHIRQILKPFN
ncbi:hypothetical protein GQ44DRAFT_638609, partial [Phaeosphaeriaceae sp. PMI808]